MGKETKEKTNCFSLVFRLSLLHLTKIHLLIIINNIHKEGTMNNLDNRFHLPNNSKTTFPAKMLPIDTNEKLPEGDKFAEWVNERLPKGERKLPKGIEKDFFLLRVEDSNNIYLVSKAKFEEFVKRRQW